MFGSKMSPKAEAALVSCFVLNPTQNYDSIQTRPRATLSSLSVLATLNRHWRDSVRAHLANSAAPAARLSSSALALLRLQWALRVRSSQGLEFLLAKGSTPLQHAIAAAPTMCLDPDRHPTTTTTGEVQSDLVGHMAAVTLVAQARRVHGEVRETRLSFFYQQKHLCCC
jgi:hypothetical protein